MLAKCTNPSCSASFRHLAEGGLFRLDTDLTLGPSTEAAEYFWLCKDCLAGMTLRLAQDGRVIATGLREALSSGAPVPFVLVNREHGRLLRRVSFLATAHPEST
jgi:hypothetical protein